jgi:hypothetical protein
MKNHKYCLTIHNRSRVYWQSEYDGSWWREMKNGLNYFIGAFKNLPIEVQKKVKK